MKFIVQLLIVLVCLAAPATCQAADAGAEALTEKMLNALGGRTVWADTTSTINVSQQNRVNEPTVVRASITMDFTQPRFRIDTQAPDFALVRVLDGSRHWRKTRDGKIEDVPAEVLAEDQKWYASHVYRSLHRIASRDPALTMRLGKDGRLEAVENGQVAIWFKLDSKGEPFAFGPGSNDAGTICGPWDFAADGIKHPIWTSSPDGTWRANLVSLVRNPKIVQSSFDRPGS